MILGDATSNLPDILAVLPGRQAMDGNLAWRSTVTMTH